MKNGNFFSRVGYALSGIRDAWCHERSFRTQILFALATPVLLLVVRPAPIWWALVGVMVVLVLAAELFNTALEHLIDYLHPERHPAIKLAKDCAAAAVLLLSVGALWVAAVMVWSTL